MTLGDKLRSLRVIEARFAVWDRPMTQSEVVEAMKPEVGRGLSQAYPFCKSRAAPARI